jgi:redox-regulated HSP33 family molecular chaperone
MFVQTSQAGEMPRQSMVAVEGIDILEIFEQYYRQSEQTPARMFEITDTEFVMIQALPEADDDWLMALDRDEALGLAEDEMRELDVRIYRYRCGCNPGRMVGVMRELFRKEPEELFHGEEGVEIACPRCGRRWWVDREEFLDEEA